MKKNKWMYHTHIFLEEVERIVWLLGLLVESHECLGERIQHTSLLQVLAELLFLAISWLVSCWWHCACVRVSLCVCVCFVAIYAKSNVKLSLSHFLVELIKTTTFTSRMEVSRIIFRCFVCVCFSFCMATDRCDFALHALHTKLNSKFSFSPSLSLSLLFLTRKQISWRRWWRRRQH